MAATAAPSRNVVTATPLYSAAAAVSRLARYRSDFDSASRSTAQADTASGSSVVLETVAIGLLPPRERGAKPKGVRAPRDTAVDYIGAVRRRRTEKRRRLGIRPPGPPP